MFNNSISFLGFKFFNYFFFINNLFYKQCFIFFFKLFLLKPIRIKFFGKGYRIFLLKRKSLVFNFGFSHFYMLYYFQIKPIIVSKFKLFFFGLNFFILKTQINLFVKTRFYNLFTSKGVRFCKQLIKKKIGKLSLYF